MALLTSRRLRWTLGLLLLVLVVVVAVLWREAGRSDPVPESEAVADLREGGVRATDGGPRPGVYRLAVSGHEEGGAGPIHVSRTLPPEGTVTVSGTPGGWEVLTTYSRQHVEAARYVSAGGYVRMVWRRVDVSFAGFGRDDRRDIRGPARLVPSAEPPVGTRWTDRYMTGTLTNVVENRVLRHEPITVGGERVATVVIRSATRTTGALSGSRDETLWWSPAHRMVVRSDLVVRIGGVFGYRSDIRSRVADLTPVT